MSRRSLASTGRRSPTAPRRSKSNRRRKRKWRGAWKRSRRKINPYVVAARAGVVAGYAYAGPYHTRPAYRWSIEDSVYVAPEFQRQGLGRLLLARLIADAEARGFRQMIAVIGDSANAGSIELHAAAGFRHIGAVQSVGFKHGRWLDCVLMQRPLGRGDATAP